MKISPSYSFPSLSLFPPTIYRAGSLARAEKDKAAARVALVAARDALGLARQQLDERALEEAALAAEHVAALAQVAALKETIAAMEGEREKAAQAVETKKEAYEAAAGK